METPDRGTIRLAVKIAAAMERAGCIWPDELHRRADHVCDNLAAVDRLRAKLRICSSHNFRRAANSLRDRLERKLIHLHADLRVCEELLHQPEPEPVTLRQIVEELQQIEREFDGYRYDYEQREIAVQTEPITLEHVPLGRFEIRVRLDRLADATCQAVVRVAALDPNPAAGESEVTHPHVKSEALCAGDATAPIGAALRAGRLCDALLLIRSVLREYGAASPYVALSEWYGVACYDCDSMVDEDELCTCNDCEYRYCDGCTTCCAQCSAVYCLDCTSRCDLCGDRYCNRCSVTCTRCKEACCAGCAENGLCQACRDELETDNEPDTESAVVAPAATAESAAR